MTAWESFEPHLVFMDMRMGGLDGGEATRRIRDREARSPERGRSVIIALSASAFEHDREALLGAGCDAFVSKPFREGALFALIEERLGVELERERLDDDEPASSGTGVLTAEALRSLSPALREPLARACMEGDVRAARAAAVAISRGSPPLGAAVLRMVDAFRFEELEALLGCYDEARST